MSPERRRDIALAVLRGCLGREPTHSEAAQALYGSGQITDPVALSRHVAQWFSGRINSERAAVAAEQAAALAERTTLKRQLIRSQAALREAVMQLEALDEQMSLLRASTSWRLTRPVRAVAGAIPPGSHQAIRRAAGAATRSLRRLPPPASADAAPVKLPFGPGTNPYDTAAAWCTIDPPVVSIVILNRATAARTIECVQRIWACTAGLPYEIIIADNGSDAPDLLRLRGVGNNVRLIDIGTDRFFGEANNIAAEAARGEFLCLLANDICVSENWLAAIHAAMGNDPTVGAAAPLIAHATDAPSADFASADALLVDLSAFLSVGGFDLAYEPGGLADVDLCYKLRLIGRSIRHCPDVVVTRFDKGPDEASHDTAVEDVNRTKLLARWGGWPGDTSPAVVERLRRDVLPASPIRTSRDAALPRAAIFTPYLLTPGGGERVILTLASVLSRTHAVEIVTLYPYSHIRLANMSREFALDLSTCNLATYQQYQFLSKPELWVTLGNHILPPVAGGGRRNWYICQFPFPMDSGTLVTTRADLAGYDVVLTYSQYALAHVERSLRAEAMETIRAEVLYPPVLLPTGNAATKRPMILSVGRFIARGHTKRHDALLDAFRVLSNRCDGGVELHIVGSSFPTDGDMEYLTELQAAAADIPVTFHVNANKQKLATLYGEAMFYWHATGYESDTAQAPERAEHFGISIVEAMAAECVAFAFAAGGPCEIIRHGQTGYLFTSLDELVDQTESLLQTEHSAGRQTVARAASTAAKRFSLDAFQERVEQLVDPRLESVTP